VLEALKRQLPIALLPVIVLVAAAVAIAYARPPVYTSEARLNVGGLNLTQTSVEGYTAAVTQLAVAYSRSIDGTGVVTPVARKLHLDPRDVVHRVSATPIQGSSVIRVRATGDTTDDARRLADAAASSLVDYAITLNSGRAGGLRLLARFKVASREFRRAATALARNGGRGAAAQTRVDAAKLAMDTAGFLYTQSQAGQAITQLVQKLAPADEPTSDRGSVLQDLLAGGAIAGGLIGVGLALARANAMARRRLGEL
jgi:uncharacterized protein involved in exopolysaccharide biosynthesis